MNLLQLTPRDLTPRWTVLRSHMGQSRLFHDPIRFKICTSGRRSGKTEQAKRKLAGMLITAAKLGLKGQRFFVGAPTRDHARAIYWDDLKQLVPRNILRGEPRETELLITTKGGNELRVVGLDRPQRIEGVPWNGCVIDEMADCREGTWRANIRPALADRGGWAWIIGVPDLDGPGQADYRQLYDLARSGSDPEWACYNWPSSDIIDSAEIESLRKTLDDDTFRQEILGEFLSGGGLAFPTFDPLRDVSDAAVYDPALPLCWALDFNIGVNCSGLIQHHRGQIRVLHEFAFKDTDTSFACSKFLAYCTSHHIDPSDVCVYGDPSGNARDSTSGTTDWKIIRERLKQFRPNILVRRSPWPIKDTVNAVRARICNAAGDRNLLIHPDCTGLIKDLSTTLAASKMEESHHLAWLRYFTIWEYPIEIESTQENGLFSVTVK